MKEPDRDVPALGRQFAIEMSGCDAATLDDLDAISSAMLEAARASGATILEHMFRRFRPQGISGVVVIAESHLAIHTWLEYGYAAVDLFTCGNGIRPERAIEHLKEKLRCGSCSMTQIERGPAELLMRPRSS